MYASFHRQLCLPKIKYCLLVYGSSNKTTRKRLSRVHKTLIKIIHRKERQSLDISFYKSNRLLNIEGMYTFDLLTLAFKIKNKQDELPRIFQNYLVQSHNTRLRSINNFELPLCSGTFEQRKSSYKMAYEWNHLPQNLKNIKVFNQFKSRIENYLLEKMTNFD